MYIEKKLYKNLTLDQKKAILEYERGAFYLHKIDNYESMNNCPKANPTPHYLYISNVLDIDFAQYYHSDEAKLSWNYKDEMKSVCGDSFIGDALTNIVWDNIWFENKKTKINKKLIKKIDADLLSIFNYFKSLIEPKEILVSKDILNNIFEMGAYDNKDVYNELINDLWRIR